MFSWFRAPFIKTRAPHAAPALYNVPGTIRDGRASLGCIILELGRTGAVLELEGRPARKLGPIFDLRPETDRTYRRVKLLWQYNNQASVEFFTAWAIPR